ncbi:MAG: biosynthetic arginine decarboxylase [Parvibaculales bacterium]
MMNAPVKTHQLADRYGIEKWGEDLIQILPNGHLGLANPHKPEATPTDLIHILDNLTNRGITAPILLRVANFLEHRIRHINENFNAAIQELNYGNRYQGVFPIKVNQQAQVVERIVDYGQNYDFGLEVGSKAELLIALSQNLAKEAALICNGVKDNEFLRLALMSQRLGFNTFIVLESPRELDMVLDLAEDMHIRPQLGVRIKLNLRVSGNWAKSSGDRSTFGMTIAQIMDVVSTLRGRDFLDCLVMQHSHLGSQVPDILEIRKATQEACRFFIELKREGAPLTHLDLGGGLGVDYTGEHTSSANSTNYSLSEYCLNIIETVKDAMDANQLDHPRIITESGRACVAQSSLLLFNVLEVTHFDSPKPVEPDENDHQILKNMHGVESYLTQERIQECWNDLIYYRDEMRNLFRNNQAGLAMTAKAERIYLYLMNKIKNMVRNLDDMSEDMLAAMEQVADIYHCNFSLFQSLPDVWAIDQIHPIAPLSHHHLPASRNVILSDITCDSDGKIDRFVLADGISGTLPVHDIPEGEDYYLGVFFVGAYQETLGDLHNLFGDTNVVTIELTENGGFEIVHELEGDTVEQVLSYVEYDPRQMISNFKKIVEKGVSSGKITPQDRREIIRDYKDSIQGYTYYEH